LPTDTQKLKSAFLACSSDEDVPVILYISKMFPVCQIELRNFIKTLYINVPI
jgi:hypothetical protein